MYQTEHDELFASIRNGKPINNGEYMAKSTLLAIMGRMAAYTGQEITWEMALNSKEDLSPGRYDWDARSARGADRRSRARRRSSDRRTEAWAEENHAKAIGCPRGRQATADALSRRSWLGLAGARLCSGMARAAGPGAGRLRRATSPRTRVASRPGSRSPA